MPSDGQALAYLIWSTLIGALISMLFTVIIMYLKSIKSEVSTMNHNLFCHRHIESSVDESKNGEVYIPREIRT